jgi:hypothetical protein
MLLHRGGLVPLHYGGYVGDVGEVREAAGATPAAFSPPTFARTASVSWFHVSLPLPHENALGGGVYI